MEFKRKRLSHGQIDEPIVPYDNPYVMTIIDAIGSIGRRYRNDAAARPLIAMIQRFCTDMVVRPYVSTLEYHPTENRLEYLTIEIEEYSITIIDGVAEYSDNHGILDTVNWSFALLRNGETTGAFHWDEARIARLIALGATIHNTTMHDSYFIYDQIFHTQGKFDRPEPRRQHRPQGIPLPHCHSLREIELAISQFPEDFTQRLEQHRNRRIKSFVLQQLHEFGTGRAIPQFSFILTRYVQGKPSVREITYECLTFDCDPNFIIITESEILYGNGKANITDNWMFTLNADGQTTGEFNLDASKLFDYAEDNGRLHLEKPVFN